MKKHTVHVKSIFHLSSLPLFSFIFDPKEAGVNAKINVNVVLRNHMSIDFFYPGYFVCVM